MKERADFVVPLLNVRPRSPLGPEDINPLTGKFFFYTHSIVCVPLKETMIIISYGFRRCDISEEFMASFYASMREVNKHL